MSFTCVFLPFYIKVYYCEMFGFFWRCVWLFYVMAIWQPCTTVKTLTQCGENSHPLGWEFSPAKVAKVRTRTPKVKTHFWWQKWLLPRLFILVPYISVIVTACTFQFVQPGSFSLHFSKLYKLLLLGSGLEVSLRLGIGLPLRLLLVLGNL